MFADVLNFLRFVLSFGSQLQVFRFTGIFDHRGEEARHGRSQHKLRYVRLLPSLRSNLFFCVPIISFVSRRINSYSLAFQEQWMTTEQVLGKY
jgi:hypothetical protein